MGDNRTSWYHDNIYPVMQDIKFIIPLTCIFGLIGNLWSFVVLRHKNMRSPFNTLLLGLAIADMLFLITQFIYFFEVKIGGTQYRLNWLINEYTHHTIYYFIRSWAQLASIYLTLGISTERYVAISYPKQSMRIFKRSTWIAIAIFVIAAIPCLGNFAPFAFAQDKEEHFRIYKHVRVWHNVFFKFGVPFIVLVFLNTSIYMKLRRRKKDMLTYTEKLETSATKLLLCVVLLFGICYFISLLRAIPYTLNVYFGSKAYYSNPQTLFEKTIDYLFYADTEENMLVTINSSVNFILYFAIGTKFRDTSSQIFNSILVKLKCRSADAEEASRHKQDSCQSMSLTEMHV